MTLQSLLLLRHLLTTQQMHVGAEDFRSTVPQVLTALDELDQAISEAEREATR